MTSTRRADLGGFIAALDLQDDAPALPSHIVEMKGDSMAPTINSGDRVLVDERFRFPSPGGVFVYWEDGEPVISRMEYQPYTDPPVLTVIRDNRHYSSFEIPARDLAIAGRVTWIARRT
ncbi:MAG: S24 family peptidase [Alphaproteobacteria bacterium]